MTTMTPVKFEECKKTLKTIVAKSGKSEAQGFLKGIMFAMAVDYKQQLVLGGIISPGNTKA